MQKDINELKRYVSHLNGKEGGGLPAEEAPVAPAHILLDDPLPPATGHIPADPIAVDAEIIPDSLSLQEKEKEMIVKALQKNNGRRKETASDLGISERTLYRKLKEYQLDTK